MCRMDKKQGPTVFHQYPVINQMKKNIYLNYFAYTRN